MENYSISEQTKHFANAIKAFDTGLEELEKALREHYEGAADQVFDAFYNDYFDPMKEQIKDLMIEVVYDNVLTTNKI